MQKYAHLSHSYSLGSVGVDSLAFSKDLGHCVKMTTGEPQSFTFLMRSYRGLQWRYKYREYYIFQCWAPLASVILRFITVEHSYIHQIGKKNILIIFHYQ